MRRTSDAIEVLEAHHREILRLLDRGGPIEPLADAVVLHAALEEGLFYPTVRAHGGAELVMPDHARMRHLASTLLRNGAGAPLFGELADELARHLELQRAQLFPAVRRILTPQQLDVVGQQLLAVVTELEGCDPRDDLRSDPPRDG